MKRLETLVASSSVLSSSLIYETTFDETFFSNEKITRIMVNDVFFFFLQHSPKKDHKYEISVILFHTLPYLDFFFFYVY